MVGTACYSDMAMKSLFPPCFKTCGAGFFPTLFLYVLVQPQLAVFSGSSLDHKVSVSLSLGMGSIFASRYAAWNTGAPGGVVLKLNFDEAFTFPSIMSEALVLSSVL